jgi:septal ring factor EnvC (AmiA/AmiB activator)
LILNAGGGYYLVLSGLKRIDVTLGQFVLAGEPVGVMGETRDAAALAAAGAGGGTSAANGIDGPALYVEFRKDGVPIDPGPWWAKQDDRKVRG